MNINRKLYQQYKVHYRCLVRLMTVSASVLLGLIAGVSPLQAVTPPGALSPAAAIAPAPSTSPTPSAVPAPSDAPETTTRAAQPHGESPELPLADLSAGLLRAHRVILLGERHDHPEHHANQARWLEALAEAGPVAVVVEMIGLDQLGAIKALPQNAEEWASELDWAESGWPEFEMYAPIFEVIARYRLSVLAGTVGPPSGHGMQAHVAELEAQLETTPAPPPAVARALEADVTAGHCDLLPAEMVPPMAEVQWLKDAFMAAQLRTGLAFAERVVLIAGNGHTQAASGVPVHLSELGDALLSVVQVEGGEVQQGDVAPGDIGQGDIAQGDIDQGRHTKRLGAALENAEQPQALAGSQAHGGLRPSVAVVTRAIPMPDHCEALRAHFGGSAKD